MLSALPKADEGLHGLLAPSGGSTIFFTNSLADEFGNGGSLLPRSDVQGLPDVFVQIKLGTFHDV
jgi:hypothetical protein